MSRFLYSLVLLLFASLYSAFAAPFPLKKDASVNLVARGNVYTGSVSFPRIELFKASSADAPFLFTGNLL